MRATGGAFSPEDVNSVNFSAASLVVFRRQDRILTLLAYVNLLLV
jgi:hypothetical protein